MRREYIGGIERMYREFREDVGRIQGILPTSYILSISWGINPLGYLFVSRCAVRPMAYGVPVSLDTGGSTISVARYGAR